MKKVGRPPGIPKTGGRTKGTPNKITSDLRSWLSDIIDRNREQIELDLEALEPKDRLMMLEKFMQYTTPKMQSIQAEFDISNLTDNQIDLIVNQILHDL